MRRALTMAAVLLGTALSAGTASGYELVVNKTGPAPLGEVDIRIENSAGSTIVLLVNFSGGAGATFTNIQVGGTVKVKRTRDAANWRDCKRYAGPLTIPENAQRVTLTVDSYTVSENKQDPHHIYGCIGDFFQ